MTDNPVPVPQAPLEDRLLEAAQRHFPHLAFEVFDEPVVELFCVARVVDGEAGTGEMSVESAAVADPSVAAGDELLFMLAKMNGAELESEFVIEGILQALQITSEQIRGFVEEFNQA